jgi:hypothetical protein
VSGYEILRELGRGGMGVVYEARHLRLNRVVALKMILAGAHAGADQLERFRTEAEAIARLQHANIVQVFEVGEHDGRPYLALEFCTGGSLEQKLNGTPLPPQEAAGLVETMARAMHTAHQKGVIHRDLKPANVLLAEHGSPKITDFGLAKKFGEPGQTASGAVMGTPSYMAPEQAGYKPDAQVKEIGPACDVYALGAILYECLTGRPPFKAATALDTLIQVVSDEPVPPAQLQPKTPRDLETICLRCLHKEARRRYMTAQELADDLRRFLEGEPIRARPVGRAERAAKWAKRKPAVAALVLVSGLTALTLTGGGWWSNARLRAARGRAEDNLRLARRHLYAAEITLAQKAWETGDTARLVGLLDAHRPGPGVEDLRGFEWYYLWRLCHRNRATLDAHDGTVVSLTFTPDGRTLMSANAGGSVRFWDAATGAGQFSLKDSGVVGASNSTPVCPPTGAGS